MPKLEAPREEFEEAGSPEEKEKMVGSLREQALKENEVLNDIKDMAERARNQAVIDSAKVTELRRKLGSSFRDELRITEAANKAAVSGIEADSKKRDYDNALDYVQASGTQNTAENMKVMFEVPDKKEKDRAV